MGKNSLEGISFSMLGDVLNFEFLMVCSDCPDLPEGKHDIETVAVGVSGLEVHMWRLILDCGRVERVTSGCQNPWDEVEILYLSISNLEL